MILFILTQRFSLSPGEINLETFWKAMAVVGFGIILIGVIVYWQRRNRD